MASIQEHLDKIKNAVFGKDVRQAIHDSIEECYRTASVDHDNANMEVKRARGTHETLNDRLVENEKKQENLSAQLDTKANKNEVFSMANMGQDIKEAMTGGSVAVVGENTVLTNNIVDNQVTVEKTDFIDTLGIDIYDSQYNKNINIWETINNITVSSDGYENCRGIIHPVKPNTTYKLRKLSTTDKFSIVLLNSEEIADNIYLGDKTRLIVDDSSLTEYIFNTGSYDYIAFQYSKTYQSTNIKLIEDYSCKLNAYVNFDLKEKSVDSGTMKNGCVITEKIKDNQITGKKTTFIEENGKDIYNTSYNKKINIRETVNNVTVSIGWDNTTGGIIPVKPNTTYKIAKKNNSNSFRIVLFNSSELSDEMYLPKQRIVTLDDTLNDYILNTLEFNRIAYQHSNHYQDVNIEVLEDYSESLSTDISINKILNETLLSNFTCKNKQIYDISTMSAFWGINVTTKTENGYVFNITQSNMNRGISTGNINPNDLIKNELEIKFNVTELTSGEIGIWLNGKDKAGKDYLHLMDSFNTVGEHKTIIDLVNKSIYSNLDLNSVVQVMIGNKLGDESTTTNFTISNFDVYDNNSDLDTSKDLQQNLNIIKKDVETIKLEVKTQKPIFLTNSDGDQYALQIDGSTLTLIPKIPNNVLFIGNSLLLGFGTFGMAASNNKSDYCYHVQEYIKTNLPAGKELVINKLHGSAIESLPAPNHSSETIWYNDRLSPLCSNDVQLVIVQLGDNVNDSAKLANWNPLKLCKYLRKNCPNARVVWVGMWYYREEAYKMVADACNKTGVQLVSITDLYEDKRNQSYIGAVITHPDGTTETVDSQGVATHPGDLGMKLIAERIIEEVL